MTVVDKGWNSFSSAEQTVTYSRVQRKHNCRKFEGNWNAVITCKTQCAEKAPQKLGVGAVFNCKLLSLHPHLSTYPLSNPGTNSWGKEMGCLDFHWGADNWKVVRTIQPETWLSYNPPSWVKEKGGASPTITKYLVKPPIFLLFEGGICVQVIAVCFRGVPPRFAEGTGQTFKECVFALSSFPDTLFSPTANCAVFSHCCFV